MHESVHNHPNLVHLLSLLLAPHQAFAHPSYKAPKYEPSRREPWQVQRDKQLSRQLEAAKKRFGLEAISVNNPGRRQKKG